MAVVGRNGSGKSTLARLANGLLLPTEGRVLVAGRDTAHPDWNWEARRRVGVVFQNPDNQLVAATVEEELAFGPENLGVPPAEIDARVERGLALSGLAGRRTQPPYMLSGGQKQLLAVAAVMAMQPDVLVLDEATAMLDPAGPGAAGGDGAAAVPGGGRGRAARHPPYGRSGRRRPGRGAGPGAGGL